MLPTPPPIPTRSQRRQQQRKKSPARCALLVPVCLLRVGVVALMASSIAPVGVASARGDPCELAFAAGASALLAVIFVCLHRAARLTPESPPRGAVAPAGRRLGFVHRHDELRACWRTEYRWPCRPHW
jgi:hypothetical protein